MRIPRASAQVRSKGQAIRGYRRASSLLIHWRQGAAVLRDYVSGAERRADAITIRVLTAVGSFSREDAVADRLPDLSRAAIRGRLNALVRWGFLGTSERSESIHAKRARVWLPWSPDAAVLHFGTRDTRLASLGDASDALHTKAVANPPPPPIKPATSRQRVSLPKYSRSGTVPHLLLSRRSWRQFGRSPLAMNDLSALLGLTWGVQHWVDVAPTVRFALKTAPSPGATHSIETYLVALRTADLDRGIYHYRPDEHTLEPVRKGLPRAAVTTFLGGQPWFSSCAALFVMTSMVERVMWKYATPRAYRTILIEAGHFCQNFFLVATWLRLAPFCTAAFNETALEGALGIDGGKEVVLYIAGVGSRPPALEWAPWPDGVTVPPLNPRHICVE